MSASVAGSSKRLRIGIIGGGIAGVGLALGLSRHPHLDVQLFEAADRFGEVGAGIAFGLNAMRAIAALGMGQDYEALADRTPEPYQDIWFEWRRGSDAGYITESVIPGVGQSTIHRADFLDALSTRLPPRIARFGKQAVEVQQNIGEVRVGFADGSEYEGDVLIAADGIKSAIRSHVLRGLGHPDMSPRFTGTCAYRGLIENQRMRTAFIANGVDTHLVDVPQMYLGQDAHILTFPVRRGGLINVVAFISDRTNPLPDLDEGQPWVRPAGQQEMLEAFSGFGIAAHTILECIDNPTHWALHDLPLLPGFVHERVALIGDAAHAMLPHQGAGAGQGLEDAYFLTRLLEQPDLRSDDLPEILAAYDMIRRPRACRVQQTSWETGELYEFRDPVAGGDPQRLGEALKTHFDWIWQHDLDSEVTQGRERVRAKLEGLSDILCVRPVFVTG